MIAKAYTSTELLYTAFSCLWWHQKNLRLAILATIALLIISKLIVITIPYCYKLIVDSITHSGDFDTTLLIYIIVYIANRALLAISMGTKNIYFMKLGQVVYLDFTHDILVNKQWCASNTGETAKIIDRGTKSFQSLFGLGVNNLIPTILEILLITTFILSHYDMKYFILLVISLAINFIIMSVYTTKHIDIRASANSHDNAMHQQTLSALQAHYNKQPFALDQFRVNLTNYERNLFTSKYIVYFQQIISSIMANIFLLITICLLISDVVNHLLTTGDFILLVTLTLQAHIASEMYCLAFRVMKQNLSDINTMFRNTVAKT